MALEFLAGLKDVKKNGFVSRADFNSMLDLLEDRIQIDSENAVNAVRSQKELQSLEHQNSQVTNGLSVNDKLLSTNNAIIYLIDFVK